MVELVVVIVLVGILAAAALPKLSSFNSAAHKSSVANTAAAFRTAVNLVHVTYIQNGLTGSQDNIPDFGTGNVDVNTAGYPTDTADANSINSVIRCVNLWSGILESSLSITSGAGGGFDYVATRQGQTCTYTYQRDASTTRSFTYTATTGDVTVVNP